MVGEYRDDDDDDGDGDEPSVTQEDGRAEGSFSDCKGEWLFVVVRVWERVGVFCAHCEGGLRGYNRRCVRVRVARACWEGV